MRVQRTSESRLINWQWIVAAGLVALAITVALVGQARPTPGIGGGLASDAPSAPAQAAPLGHPSYGTGTVYDGQPHGSVDAPSWPDNYGAGYYDAYASEAARKDAAARAAAAGVTLGYEAPAGADLSQLPRGLTDYLRR
jgi:hypothetical protein